MTSGMRRMAACLVAVLGFGTLLPTRWVTGRPRAGCDRWPTPPTSAWRWCSGRGCGRAGYDEPSAMRNYLVERGVPDQHVVSDFAGFDTWDSCVRAKNVFGVNRAVLVSPAGKALVDAVLRPDPHFPGPPEPGIAFAAPR